MINLIPNEEKKHMAHNFYYRLFILSLLMVSFAICFAIVAIIPSYIISEAKENFVNEKLIIQKGEPVPMLDQNTSLAIKDLDTKLSLVENLQVDKFVVTERVINQIIESKVFDIKISNISYENNPTTGKTISISGTAPSRERLLLFRQSLEGNKAFKQIDLPISNFVKNSDIQFSLRLRPS